MSEVFRKKNHAYLDHLARKLSEVNIRTAAMNEMIVDGDKEKLESPYHRKRDLTKQEKDQGYIVMDCYDILDLVGSLNARRQHAAKKVLFGGSRGHKGLIKDLEEAIWTLQAELFVVKSQSDES